MRTCKWCDVEIPDSHLDNMCDEHWELFKRIEREQELAQKMIFILSSPPLTPHGGESDSAMRQEEHEEFVQAMKEKNDLHTMGMGG